MTDEDGNISVASIGLVITHEASPADFEKMLTNRQASATWSGGIFECKGFDALMPAGGENDYTLEQLQEAVGGNIEPVRVPESDYVTMLVNEEGLLHDLPLNQLASMIARKGIVGTVVLIDAEDLK
jgi:hypothetical protein|tara:strand:- start:680 stop:1057 length:378 start_codon:yes stop_codon:yes gene_type:complete